MTLPPPPAGLPPEQTTIWADTTTRLQALGIHTVDPRHLRAYTRAAHTLDQATYLLDQAGPFIQRGEHVAPNPAQAAHRTAARDLARLATTLGLTTPAAALSPINPGGPMQEPPHWGARWCDQHERWECTKQRSRGRGTCHGPSTDGTDMCRMHGGTSVARHLVAVAARGPGQRGPLPGGRELPDVHPADALLGQVRYWAGLTGWLDEMVAGLEKGSMVWGLVRETTEQGGEFPGTTRVMGAALHVWVQWHQQAHRMLAHVCEIALRAEVDQAALALQQAQGMQAFRAFQTGLLALGLSEAQWATARQEMPKVLRALAVAA